MGVSMIFSRCAALAATLLLICAGGASARPVDPAENRFIPFNGSIPSCDDWWTLNYISNDFNVHEHWFFNSPLEITEIEKTGEIGYRTNGLDFVPRRYCVARARFNDGRAREVKYNLIEGGGFVGIGEGIQWCVVGLDRYHVYSPACSAAGP
jgi:hypothetical protein